MFDWTIGALMIGFAAGVVMTLSVTELVKGFRKRQSEKMPEDWMPKEVKAEIPQPVVESPPVSEYAPKRKAMTSWPKEPMKSLVPRRRASQEPDTSDIPEAKEDWFKKAKLQLPQTPPEPKAETSKLPSIDWGNNK